MRTSLELAARRSGSIPLVNLGGLGLVAFGAADTPMLASGRDGALALTVFVLGGLCWLARLALSMAQRETRTEYLVVLALWSICGGALVPYSFPLGAAFVGLAGLMAGVHVPSRRAAAISLCGPAAALITEAATGRGLEGSLWTLAVAAIGFFLGLARRQSVEEAVRSAEVALASERAEIERGRADVLSERNRLAREIHDVLAHTLSALSLQLEALSAVAESRPLDEAALGGEIERSKRLVHEGLDEARHAVRALRGDSRPLEEKLEELCAGRGASFSATGPESTLAPPSSQALYRVAQEALTNVLKHAPGSTALVRLETGAAGATLIVENSAATGAPGSLGLSGDGFGLAAMRERLVLAGGEVEVGPSGEGWRVVARVPA